MSAELQTALMVSPPSGALDQHMLILLAIMLVAGLLGGVANCFLADKPTNSGRREWLKYSVFGVVVALTVPLFLNMISSTLLEGARTKPIDLFAFAGFCLIAVVASRRLMENVALLLKKRIDTVERNVVLLGERPVPLAVGPSAIKNIDPAALVAEEGDRMEALDVLSYNDIEMLRALVAESVVYGNLADICERTGLAREYVSKRLPVLKTMGVIETRINDKNILHWAVSMRGKAVLGEISSAHETKKVA